MVKKPDKDDELLLEYVRLYVCKLSALAAEEPKTAEIPNSRQAEDFKRVGGIRTVTRLITSQAYQIRSNLHSRKGSLRTLPYYDRQVTTQAISSPSHTLEPHPQAATSSGGCCSNTCFSYLPIRLVGYSATVSGDSTKS